MFSISLWGLRPWFSAGYCWITTSSLGGGGEILPRVKDFKYLWVLFTSDGETEREMVGRQQDCGEDLLVHICCMFTKKLHRQTVALNTVTDLLLLFR